MDSPDQPRITIIAEMIIDFMDNAIVQSQSLPEYPWADTWVHYFESLFWNSPALRYYWAENGKWYSSDLNNVLSDILASVSRDKA